MAAIDPSVLVAPDYQTQMLQAQHRLALAQQLQQMSMQDTPGNGGTVSWTQGLARLADALVGGMAAKKGYKEMQGANQAYAAGLRGMFGQPPQAPQATSQGAQPVPQPPMPQGGPPMPQGGSPAPQAAPVDPLAPLPDAPPQAAPPQPAAMPPQGGAPSAPWSLTGNPQRDMALYMSNPEEFGKAMIGNAAKGGAPNDMEITLQHAQQAAARGDYGTAAALYQSVQKNNHMPDESYRPGGWSKNPTTGQLTYHPQAPAPGAMPVMDANGKPTGAWTDDPSAARIQAQQAGAIAGAQAAGKAPYEFQPTFENGQPGVRTVANLTGHSSGAKYTPGAGGAPSGAPAASGPTHGNGFIPTGAPLGAPAGANTFATNEANRFQQIQDNAAQSRQQEQSLYELEGLVGKGLKTGPWLSKQQDFAERFGLTPLANSDAIVFNKDSARLVTQMAQNVGLNGSDQRLGMLANATPNLHMTPEALKQILPVVHGLSFANRAMADASAQWLKSHNNDFTTMPQFETWWRQNYDPRMFTALTHGPASFKAEIANMPPDKRQYYMQKYYALRDGGVNFAQFAQ